MLINRHARLGYGSEWATGNEMVCLSIKPELVYFCYWGPNGLIRSYINGLYCKGFTVDGVFFLLLNMKIGKAAAVWTLY